MASQTQGIQQLLAAEKKATEKVVEAKKRKFIGIGPHSFIFIYNFSLRHQNLTWFYILDKDQI